MSYQNINQYNFRRWGLRPVNEITDICLASDEKSYNQDVIFSPLLIGEDDGNRMPFRFDINSSATTYCQEETCDFEDNVIVSENYWNPLEIDVNFCPKVTTLCDVGLTGIDNGLVKNMSGETIELTTGLYTQDSDIYSRYKFDRRLKMHPITGFTTSENRLWDDDSYTYDLTYHNDNNLVGYYAKLNGGFYQGFYKVAGYDYQIFPERVNLGWTAEFMLRYRWTGDTSVGLNKRYPDNKGTFFFMGARAENKFYHYADGSPKSDTGYTRVTSGLTCMHTCSCAISGNTDSSSCIPVYQISGGSSTNCSCGCNCACAVNVMYPEKDPLYDGISNAMSLRLSGDTGNPRLCVKTYTITGSCESSGTCLTATTYVTGTSTTEWCSTRGIFHDCEDNTYVNFEHWVQIDAVFRRKEWFDTCDLYDKGGLGLIVSEQYTASTANNSISLIMPPTTSEIPYDPAKVEVVNFNTNWLVEKPFRMGTLYLYVNGSLFMVVENFEEIIPRLLNVEKEKQIGVSYNISLGGGTQGLHDNLTFSGGCPAELSGITYQQDPECLTTEDLTHTIYSGLTTQIHLEEIFGGSMIGDISAFRMYTEPLDVSQVKHNFRILRNRYTLLDPDCPKCGILVPDCDIEYDIVPTSTPTPTLTLTPTPTLTPFYTQTPTPSVTSTITPTPTKTTTNTTTSTPTPTPTHTLGISPTPTESPTQTPTTTPTPSSTPASTLRAYLFIEPITGSSSIGQWMYDNGSDFYGFSNDSQPAQNQSLFDSDMNLYVDFSGWTSGLFPSPLQQVIPQTSGGVDEYDNPVVKYNFTTTQVSANTVTGDAWYTWILPDNLTNNKKQVEIDLNNTGNPNLLTAVKTEPTIYQYSFNYTGSTIQNTTYSVYTTYPNLIFKLNNTQNIYFRGNSVQ